MSSPTPSAREVAEDLLERSGQGMMTGDFVLFSSCFSLPTRMETFEGSRVLETLEELKTVFDGVRAYYKKTGVTAVRRHIVDAEYRNPTSIVSTHNASTFVNDELIQQPYDVLSVLELRNGSWTIRHSEYLITDVEEHSSVFAGPDPEIKDLE